MLTIPSWMSEMGRACPLKDKCSHYVLMSQQTRKEFYNKFLGEGLPSESHLPTHLLHDYFLAEIAVKTIENKQGAMVILSSFRHVSLAYCMRRIF
jgi:pre-mRNA-splicing helicase BRR2